MAYIDYTATSTTITAYLAGLDTEYSKDDRVCTWYVNGVWKGTSTLKKQVSSGGSFKFTDLSPGTGYAIMCSIKAPSWADPVELDDVCYTEEITVEYWSWDHSNGEATDLQTVNAYNAVRNKGYTSDFHRNVWNDLVMKVSEVLDYYGYSWDDNYATYSGTRMGSDTTITAKKFNSLRWNVGIHYSTGIQEKYPGDIILGQDFLTLAQKINEWIG